MATTIKGERNWSAANQRYLMTAVALVQAKLEAHFRKGPSRVGELQEALGAARAEMDTPAALQMLSKEFGLSLFEREIIILCAGVELAGAFGEFLRQLPHSNGATRVTFSLALAALPDGHWSALSPDSPLRYWKLIELSPGGHLVNSPLRLDERVLHFLTGTATFDERLNSCFDVAVLAEELPASHEALAGQIAAIWTAAGTHWPAIQLCGRDTAAHRAIAAAACDRLGMKLHVLTAANLPPAAAERHQLLRLWQREAVLSDSALLVECSEGPQTEAQQFAERAGGAVIISTNQPLMFKQQAALRIDVSPLSTAEQRKLWTDALGDLCKRLNGEVDEALAQFNLNPTSIEAAARLVRARSNDTSTARSVLWEACRSQVNSQVGELAQLIEARAEWDDLVLPEGQKRILRTLLLQVRHRTKVYESWGFAARSARGLGISTLFAGPSGTGKTMAAEVLARALELDLYRIDLSAVVSKYIGETEKNLRRIFDAAESGGAVLLFDEADALFGKRSEVKDSHDRYANIEVSYLLQRMEAYRGLAILTTNQKQALDSAFVRRLRFIVQFPFPDLAQRVEIWRRIFPPETPTRDLDFNKLARLNVAGGNIRNIALNAAFLAADENAPVQMRHLLEAARGETVKLERPLTETEIAQWIQSAK